MLVILCKGGVQGWGLSGILGVQVLMGISFPMSSTQSEELHLSPMHLGHGLWKRCPAPRGERILRPKAKGKAVSGALSRGQSRGQVSQTEACAWVCPIRGVNVFAGNHAEPAGLGVRRLEARSQKAQVLRLKAPARGDIRSPSLDLLFP